MFFFLNQTSRLVLPIFQECENPSKIRSWTIGATIKSPKFIAHFLGPVSVPKTLAPLVCRKKIVTPTYCIYLRLSIFLKLIPNLTLNRSRMTPCKGKPIFISNIMLDTKDTRPISVMVTSIERKSPIREFLSMQKNILSMILCRVPISLMEPWQPEKFLVRRLDSLGPPGFWIKIKSYRNIIQMYLLPEVSSPYYQNTNFPDNELDIEKLDWGVIISLCIMHYVMCIDKTCSCLESSQRLW